MRFKWSLIFKSTVLPALIAGLISCYLFYLPQPLFEDPLSFVLLDKKGELLGARIAEDGQWRFPNSGMASEKYKQALILFEDKRFRSHTGVDSRSLVRATLQNWKEKRIISGGSTITMQLVSFYRKRKSQSIFDKIQEIMLALRLELLFDKEEIIQLYASNAPFGGNVVGIDAACWRYFQKPSSQLSWAEAATLAVLPNSPSLIHPGRNRSALNEKRNRLLSAMHLAGLIGLLELELALAEEIPEKPFPLPDHAPHLLESMKRVINASESSISSYHSTIDKTLQITLNSLAARHHERLRENRIFNLGILVMETSSGKVLSYIGNAPQSGMENAGYVDIIRAPRSPGSLLKPFLYEWMLETGEILPDQLVPDIPVYMSGFRPENYHKSFAGAVPASQALQRSLNIPFALLLKDYGSDRFLRQLRKCGFAHMTQSVDHYGLSLILGGVEATMWEIGNAYRLLGLAAMGQSGSTSAATLNHSILNPIKIEIPFEPYAAYTTLQTLSNLERPSELGDWKKFESSKKISWKTGTSHGFRDAWAVGMDQDYLVVVWVGNAKGEGRPGIVGIHAAAPILFDVIQKSGKSNWFSPPIINTQTVAVCQVSGFVASPHCPSKILRIPVDANFYSPCSFHSLIWVDTVTSKRVHAGCKSPHTTEIPWFILSPMQEHYYQRSNPSYQPLPPWDPNCIENENIPNPMQWIYPKSGMVLSLPKQLSDQSGESVFKIAHRDQHKKVYWYLNQEWIGTTSEFHQVACRPTPGYHTLLCVDEDGHELKQLIQVIWAE